MNIKRATTLAVALAMIGVLYGCPPAPTPPPPMQKPVVPDAVATSIHRVEDSGPLIDQFALGALDLPGRTEAAHRLLMGKCFTALDQILPLLQGTISSQAFPQQLGLIDSSRLQLQTLPPDQDSSPTINIGLRAAYNALVNIDRQQFADYPDIAKTLQSLGARMDELDSTFGPMSKQVQAEAAQIMGKVMQQMHQVMKDRLGAVIVVAAPPATVPAPAIRPAMPGTRR